ncbi:MAG: hypothetical protein ACLGSD_18960 [Acidobacteriota bacterium]
MRVVPVVLLISALSLPACAASPDSQVPDLQAINILEQRASQAQPREQAYLYAELVHEMIEYSARQYSAGETEQATGLLKKAQLFTHKLHMLIAANDKKLKDAQIILRRTAFRLTEMLHSSDYQDRPVLEQTLNQLNEAQNDAMLAVFRK